MPRAVTRFCEQIAVTRELVAGDHADAVNGDAAPTRIGDRRRVASRNRQAAAFVSQKTLSICAIRSRSS
ncbi:MAG: hypothetical protein K0R87_199 [Pseudonocardia sp.]|nr:hypothetical protein [Pseudonocardia sp.]